MKKLNRRMKPLKKGDGKSKNKRFYFSKYGVMARSLKEAKRKSKLLIEKDE